MWANTVSSVAELKAFLTLSRTPPIATGTPIPLVISQDIKWLFFNASSTATPDDVSVFKPDDVLVENPGRWLVDGLNFFGQLNQANSWSGNQKSEPILLTIDALNPSLEINAELSNYFILNPSINFNILTPTNSKSGQWFILSIMQPANPVLLEFSGAFRYMNKVKPQLTLEGGAIDEVLFRCRTGGVSPVWLVSPALNFGIA